MEQSSDVLKFIPGRKAKTLSVMIPIVIAAGIGMIALDFLDVANAKEQNAQKTGVLLLAFALYSLRGLNRYRIFFELNSENLVWTQGFRPFVKQFTINYSDIESLTVTALTTSLIISAKGLPKPLRLAPSFRLKEGMLARPTSEVIEKEIASNNPAVRDIYFLKYEIEKRMAKARTVY